MDQNGPEAAVGPRQLLMEAAAPPIELSSEEKDDTAFSRAQSLVQSPEWPRLGDTSRRDGLGTEDPVPDEGAGQPVDINLEIDDGETTLFEAAIGAFHAGEFQRAESLFLEEAQRTVESAPQRAAIAYRQAALAAQQMGNTDASDHWMRLAGREYLRVTEDDRTPLPFIREAAVMAAKCFLSVENLKVASKGLRRAQAIESVLRADDDLMAEGGGDPVESLPESSPAEVGLRIERRATTRPASDTPSRRPSAEAPPSDADGDGDAVPPVDEHAVPLPAAHSSWLRRLRHPRPARHVA